MKKEDNQNSNGQNSMTIFLVIIIVALVFVCGYLLGNKNNLKPEPETTGNGTEKAPNPSGDGKEKLPDPEDKPEKKPEDKPDNNKKDAAKLGQEAYKIIPKSYDVINLMEKVYAGKEVDLTKLDSSLKMDWIFYVMGNNKNYKIPYCTQDGLAISADDIEKESIFEDNSFIESYKNKGLSGNYNGNYKNDKFYVSNSNCDGRGTGATAWEKVQYNHAIIKDDILTVSVYFAYFEPHTEDYENNIFTYDVYDSYTKKTLIERDAKVSSDTELTTGSSATYEFKFKIDNEKLYPLSVRSYLSIQ